MIFSLYEYELEFSTPLPLKGVLQKNRRGVLLELKDKECRFAEASPLPFYSQETLEESIAQIIFFSKALEADLWKQERLLPSVRFALECLFRKKELKNINVCNYLQGTKEELLFQLEKYKNSNCLKIKLGIFSPKEALAILQMAFQICKSDALFRIDINQEWDLSELEEFCKGLIFERVEFIEEPLKNPFQLNLIKNVPKIFALDESIRNHPIDDLLKVKNVKALVIKPTLDSNLLFEKFFKDLVADHDLDLVFSSCYESEVGLSHISSLADEFGSTSALGIDTGKLFKNPLQNNYRKIYEYAF